MPTRTYKAHVFTSQGSQAIRLPKALRLRGKIVQIQKTKAGLIVIDPKPLANRVRAFAQLSGSCPDFPDDDQRVTSQLPTERSCGCCLRIQEADAGTFVGSCNVTPSEFLSITCNAHNRPHRKRLFLAAANAGETGLRSAICNEWR